MFGFVFFKLCFTFVHSCVVMTFVHCGLSAGNYQELLKSFFWIKSWFTVLETIEQLEVANVCTSSSQAEAL